MLMLMTLGMLMAMRMVPVVAIHPCHVPMLMAMVMLMTMVENAIHPLTSGSDPLGVMHLVTCGSFDML